MKKGNNMGRRKKKRPVDPHEAELKEFLSTYRLCGYEIFYLHYHGINVFLCVGEIDYDGVYVYEVETIYHPEMDAEGLRWNKIEGVFEGKGSYDCYIIPDGADNSYLGKAMKIKPVKIDGEVLLPVQITMNSKLYKAASLLNTITLPIGIYYCKKICDGSNDSIRQLMETGFETKLIPTKRSLVQKA